MPKHLLHLFSVLLGVILLVVVPTNWIYQQNDSRVENYARKITVNFEGSIRKKGYINQKMLDDYIKELSLTNRLYNIELNHSKELAVPLKVTDPEYNVDKPWTNLIFEYGTDKILNELKNKKTYKMSQYDNFYITISPKSQSRGSMMRSYLFKASSTQVIRSGGMVLNEDY